MMDYSVPQPVWQGQDAYIIGGGPSLRNFDWNLLEGLNTIGCNDAYKLGKAFCKVCVFGDAKWYHSHFKELTQYEGQWYTAEPSLNSIILPDTIKRLKRYSKGLQMDGVGWNGNTGMVALNLAILYGATRIYLLGFDMKRTPQHSNWHDNNLDKNPPSVYKKFLDWMKFVEKDWKEKFSHVEIINLTEDSDLSVFPKQSIDLFFLKRKVG